MHASRPPRSPIADPPHPARRADAHLWNFDYWSDKIPTKQGWVDGASNPAKPLAAGDMEMFKTQMDRFCPGREMGGLMLSTPNMAADNLGHSAWSAEECRKTMAANPGYGFFVRLTPLTNGGDHSFGGRFGPLRNRPPGPLVPLPGFLAPRWRERRKNGEETSKNGRDMAYEKECGLPFYA